MFSTAKQVLAELDHFFASSPDALETKKLWDILSLIRGPDDSHSKEFSTSLVRGRAFPITHASGRMYGSSNSLPIREIKSDGSHFGEHARAAREALLSIFPETASPAAGAGLYDARSALVTLGKVQD